MKKLLEIVVLSLLCCSTALASEVILRCKVVSDYSGANIRAAVEVNLKKKTIHIDDNLFQITTIGERTIVAKRKTKTLKLDRYDGYFDLSDSSDDDELYVGYCKKYNIKIF